MNDRKLFGFCFQCTLHVNALSLSVTLLYKQLPVLFECVCIYIYIYLLFLTFLLLYNFFKMFFFYGYFSFFVLADFDPWSLQNQAYLIYCLVVIGH